MAISSLFSNFTLRKFIFLGIQILFFSLFIFVSLSYVYTGNFQIPTKFIRYVSLLYLAFILFQKNGNSQFQFFAIFLVYLSFTNPVPSSDLIPARFFPLWLDQTNGFEFKDLLNQTIHKEYKLEEFSFLKRDFTDLPHNIDGKILVLPYYLVPGKFEYLPSYPWTPGIINFLFAELFTIPTEFLPLDPTQKESSILFLLPKLYQLEKFTAALLSTLSAYFLYLILQKKPFSKTKYEAFIIVILYSFCTSHFSNSSQALWQHTTIEFFLSILLYLLFHESQNIFKFLLIGFIAAVLIYSRPSSIFLLSFPVIYCLQNFTELKWKLIFSGIIFGVSLFLFGIINFHYYDDVMGGYNLHKKAYALAGYSDLFQSHFLEGLIGLTISPGFGYYFFSPFLLFPFLLYKKIENKTLLGLLFLPQLLILLFYSKYIFWEGGHSYGSRFLTDINLFSILMFSLLPFDSLQHGKIKYSLLLLIVFSFGIQFYGTNQKESVSLWNSCRYNSNFEKAFDFKNLPFWPNLNKSNCIKINN
ncbi:hypothetical protein [Leptospira jelokensis]|uniref:Glycosyltransferase RgtA/B/C/D-like domain-containing protein n=1 Tax=Leptospira jelokensis TaxID=2484931 RepID=A0A4Z0ZYH8_9LEPT|nr:hypothetical protein [Leptospira jelokensis]TGL76612.1 hypothetical protein EHQ62_00910 [Leptospira jelokensis]